MNGAEDAQELVVVDVLREVQRERGVEVIRVPRAECHHVGAVERPVADAACVSPALRRAHEGLGEIDADILADPGADEIEQHAVAAPEVGHDLVAGQIEERQHAPHPLDRVRVVLIDVALIVDGLQLFFRRDVARVSSAHDLPRFRFEPRYS